MTAYKWVLLRFRYVVCNVAPKPNSYPRFCGLCWLQVFEICCQLARISKHRREREGNDPSKDKEELDQLKAMKAALDRLMEEDYSTPIMQRVMRELAKVLDPLLLNVVNAKQVREDSLLFVNTYYTYFVYIMLIS